MQGSVNRNAIYQGLVESDTISSFKYRGGNDGVCSIGAITLLLEYIHGLHLHRSTHHLLGKRTAIISTTIGKHGLLQSIGWIRWN